MIGCANNILDKVNTFLQKVFDETGGVNMMYLTKEEIEEYKTFINFPFGGMYHTFIHRKMIDGVEIVNVYRIKIEEEDNYE